MRNACRHKCQLMSPEEDDVNTELDVDISARLPQCKHSTSARSQHTQPGMTHSGLSFWIYKAVCPQGECDHPVLRPAYSSHHGLIDSYLCCNAICDSSGDVIGWGIREYLR